MTPRIFHVVKGQLTINNRDFCRRDIVLLSIGISFMYIYIYVYICIEIYQWRKMEERDFLLASGWDFC